MTVLLPMDAFEEGCRVTLRRPKPRVNKGKLVSIGITVLLHVVIIGAALTAVQVSRTHAPREISVSVLPDRPRPREDLAPPPKLLQPTIVAVETPIVPVVVQQSPVVAVPPPPKAAPVAAPVAPSPVAVEGRDVFLGKLLAQLNRFKQYPRSARQAHIEGVVQLHFVMDAQGKVLSFEIAKSSGRPVLDAEALALIQRAQPLPALPADYPTRTLDAIVPIEFYLDR